MSSYTRLSGARRGLSCYTWHLAPDHLLLERRIFWHITYHRIALADIQSILIFPTHRQRARGAIWLGLGVLVSLPFFFYRPLAGWLMLAIAGVAPAVFELISRPFAESRLATPTSTFTDPLANRLDPTREVVHQLRERILAIQPAWSPPETVELAAAPPPASGATPSESLSYATRPWSWALALATLLLAISGILDLIQMNQVTLSLSGNLPSYALGALFGTVSIIGAVVVFRHPARSGIRAIAIANLCTLPVLIFLDLMGAIISAATHAPGAAITPGAIWKSTSEIEASFSLAMALFEIVWFLAVGGHFSLPASPQPETAEPVSAP